MSDKVWNGSQMVYLPDPLPLPSVVLLQSQIDAAIKAGNSTARDSLTVTFKSWYVSAFTIKPVSGLLLAQPITAVTNLKVPGTAQLRFQSIPANPPVTGGSFLQGLRPTIIRVEDYLYG